MNNDTSNSSHTSKATIFISPTWTCKSIYIMQVQWHCTEVVQCMFPDFMCACKSDFMDSISTLCVLVILHPGMDCYGGRMVICLPWERVAWGLIVDFLVKSYQWHRNNYNNENDRIERHNSRFLYNLITGLQTVSKHIRSSRKGAVVCKSCATHGATCYMPQGMKGQFSYKVWQSLNHIYFSCILLAETINW